MKKIFTLFTFISFLANSLFAQVWMKNVNQGNQNFFEIQKAFNDYWKGKPIEKGKGYKQFKRWEWYWEQRVGKDGQLPASDVNWKEWVKYSVSQKNSNPIQTMSGNWTFKGPNTSAGGYNGLGRINCIGFHPTIANTFWVGTPAGGLWKTTDGGNTWTTNTDNFPVLGISDIAIDYSNPNTMYIATGDGDAAISLSNGEGDTKSIGVLKSTDGGATWNTTGLNWNVTSAKLIRRLVMSPVYPQELIAATSDGIWRTLDGGTNWSQVQSGYFMDAEYKPNNSDTIYASTYDPSGGNAEIYRSTDYGTSWTSVATLSGVSRINLAVTPNSPDLVDALCATSSDAGLEGLWYSANSGASFTQYLTGSCSNNMLNSDYTGSGCGGQGTYDLAYAINPADANEIWLGGVNTWRTTDGGSTWNLNNVWSASQTTSVPEIHADKHFIAFHPLTNDVYECNDGGIYVTDDGGATWTDLTDGMGISQIYRIGTSETVANNVICGLQDNGSKELDGGLWDDRTGGDGMECIIDYTNANIQYGTYVEGQISKTTDGWATENIIVQNNGTAGTVDEPGAWVTPYIMHPSNNNTLLVGKSQVYETTDGGSTWSQLGTISGASGNIISMAYAPSNAQVIYVATADQIYKTTNGGGTWTLINTSTERITYITVDPLNSQGIFFTKSGYTAGDKVWYSPDGGTTWSNYSGTLPNIPVNCIVYEDGSNDGLYIGTDVGVYYTDGSMSDWVLFSTGLPNVVVNELEISYNNNKLWAATFGRGLWNSDLFGTFTGLNDNLISSNQINVFPNPTNGNITIQTSEEFKNSLLEVYDVMGRIILSKKIENTTEQINLTEERNGIYYLKAISDFGITTKKIILTK